MCGAVAGWEGTRRESQAGRALRSGLHVPLGGVSCGELARVRVALYVFSQSDSSKTGLLPEKTEQTDG